ncbi:MAG: excinuclease ABC subunit A [Crocinitomicaceae bacterium]|nr:excinuclease ABC subunit A [Crocinitomicaceae bacterium]|tara:strand:+ start:76583 stop:79405 length:2823 start_codon:yes stop_codon:yes gene_type:complete
MRQEFLEVYGAREHNLKNIDVKIPRNKLVVITGLSGSGKSSLAFDTIYAEGQRRYIETFASYARQFIGALERPDVDKISGLSPVISIEQKTVNKSPRSTVGTITEIYDFVRLLYARASDAYSYNTGEKMVQYSDEEILKLIQSDYKDQKISILAPLVRGRKGHYRELFQNVSKKGFLKVRVDGELQDIIPRMQLDRYKTHDIEVVIDRLKVDTKSKSRIKESFKTAMKMGNNVIMVQGEKDDKARFFSRNLMCPSTGIAYDLPAPNLFSFNSPKGACPHCNGLGEVSEVDLDKIIPDTKKTIKQGGLAPLGAYKANWIFKQVEGLLSSRGYKITSPLSELDEETIDQLLYGSNEEIVVESQLAGVNKSYRFNFDGIVNMLTQQRDDDFGKGYQRWAQSFMNKVTCPNCEGTRLKKQALYFKIDNKNIGDIAGLNIAELGNWFASIESKLSKNQGKIAEEVVKEIRTRIQFLLDVGLSYLSLNRSAKTLSGGEAQRIRLATQIGSQLVGVLYILDEPSIGLHQRDNSKLIVALKNLRDIGNSVMVVEHDKDMMLDADYIFDIGPGAGIHGGHVVEEGTPKQILKGNSETAAYLNGKKQIEVRETPRKGNGKKLILKGASGHNLKQVNIDLPLGKFILVTGVSGSGKSSLVNHTLYPILNQYVYKSVTKPLPYKSIKGLEHIDKVIEIDQSPIGRTPRSNPATYTGVFSDIRNLFAQLPEAKIRGYKPGRFSFNVKGGRCETCKGAGVKTIEMNFLPDVYVTCEDCNEKRYNRETLEVRYKGKSISDVLNMTMEDALPFFEHIPSIALKIRTLNEVGLGYISLGQSSVTLSGGEAQRVKLASELAKKNTGNTFYILDEPTTGLHFEDIRILLGVLNRLVDQGNTVLVIEHNMDFIKVGDHFIDIGPEGGNEGGTVVYQGDMKGLVKCENSYTGKFLKKEIEG